MTRAGNLFSLALMATLVGLLAMAVPGDAFAQVARAITNVATLEWGAPSARNRISSNRVVTPLAQATTAVSSAPFGLPGDGLSQALLDASCAASDPVTAPAGSSSLAGMPIAPITRLVAGRPIVLAVDRPASNRDAATAETVGLHVRTDNGDEELLSFVETGADTGRFVAIVRTTVSGTLVSGDCRLGVTPNSSTHFRFSDTAAGPVVTEFAIDVLADPYGIAFDSRDGSPVGGVRITLLDVATGQPAQVFGDDGVSTFPSSVVTGQTVTDSGGTVYAFTTGDYRFPLVRRGTYRLTVEPVTPYMFPSVATAAQVNMLRRPDGQPFAILPASYGQDLVLSDAAPVRVDIPLDRPLTPIVLVKTASRAEAESGDLIQYRLIVRNPDAAPTGALTVSDLIPSQMRLRPGSVRLDGRPMGDPLAVDRQLTFLLPSLGSRASTALTYVLEVRPGAQPGDALNRARAAGPLGNSSNIADALVRIRRDTIGQRLTITGRVVDGACGVDPATRPGIAGVRIMMEDGSYAVTDRDGRYHFEGVQPGTHVVQVDDMTLPLNRVAVDCAQSVRSSGRAISRFVDGQGGALKRVDFYAVAGARRVISGPAQQPDTAPIASDRDAAGAERDWLAGEEPGIGWLFPSVDHNPRAPVVRVAIKHLRGQTVRLKADGRLVDPVTFEGTRKSATGAVAVSLWRGVPIDRQQVTLSADVVDSNGRVVEKLTRSVRFVNTAVRAELIRARSRLVADGVTRPVLALRLTDAAGRPVHHGVAGDFTLPAPYYAAVEADAQQARQLAGLERARPTWRVVGDDGIAMVELEPTTASGSVAVRFSFRDGQRVRAQRLEAWLDPGQRPWTIVGLAEGTVGFNRLSKHLESSGGGDKTEVDGRLALYAKGRIQGRWLMTLAYDSDKKRDDSRFGGVIDPSAYYTVYADQSEQRYDASSLRKLYLKLERPQFYALFGDYDTGIDEPILTRFVRSLNGAKAEYRSRQVSVVGFASDTPTRHRRDEIQGNGLSGPYALSSRNLLANGERVMLETRDRLRSDRIVDTHLLTRHVDYDIDYAAGTLHFREPVLSRSSAGDPQFIVADYEVDGVAARKLTAGGRVAVRSADQKLQLAATATRDSDGVGQTDVAGIDVRYRPTPGTEIRAEAAASRTEQDGRSGADAAWLVELEHHAGSLDVLAYASRRDSGFGSRQTNAVESGTRKVGVDARAQLTKVFQLSASAWREDNLVSAARRTAGRALLEYRGRTTSARAGLVLADDRFADGREARSTLLQLGATQRLLDNRLELDAQTELPLGGKGESVDFPARHKLAARYSVNRAVALVGSYEIADGENIESRVARIGFDLAPWAGARIALSGNLQDIAEFGPRSFAAFGLSQSLVVSKQLTIDASLDSNKTIGGVDPATIVNPLHPVASGGFLGGDGSLTEDFLAITAGATWRSARWTVTGRGEWRGGDRGDRYGATLGALRQVGDGGAVGGSFNWFTARSDGGATTRTVNAQLSWAHRPANSAWSLLDKFEVRDDRVENAVAGQPGPLGSNLDVTGDARSTRLVNSLSINWSPRSGPNWLDRTEIALFWGARYVADRYDGDDIKGFSNVVGADARFDLGRHVEVGAAGTLRAGLDFDSVAFALGPQLGFAPVANTWLQLGWNVAGFRDRDLSEDRYTRDGPYATMRLKFDQLSFAGLGLAARR